MKTVVNQWISYILCFDSKTNFRMKINAFFLWQNLWHALIYVCVCAICDAMGYCNSTVCVCACVCTLSMRVLMVGVLHDCRNILGIYTLRLNCCFACHRGLWRHWLYLHLCSVNVKDSSRHILFLIRISPFLGGKHIICGLRAFPNITRKSCREYHRFLGTKWKWML